MAHITNSEGKKVWYDMVGEGDPLVLIGGSSLVRRQWDFMVPILQDHFKVILYDQRGAGLSDRTPDGISVEVTTELAIDTWSREPLFHLSSPKDGWESEDPRKHHDYIDANDFPSCWMDLDITVEVEAKAKELAVLKLKQDLFDRH